MKVKLLKLPLLAMLVLPFLSCEKDNKNGPDNEQELITKVSLSFTTGGQTVTYSVEDKDGDGGQPPVIDPITLKANTDYSFSVTFFDSSKIPALDLTVEVKNENTAHLVCYATTGAMVSPVIQDKDSKGDPLGLECTLKTGAAGTGTLKIILKHQPDKSNANACDTGETDVEAKFDVTVQ